MLLVLKKLFSPSTIPSNNKELFYIHVPYAEKDTAKQLGAKWDPKKKSWFIPEGLDKSLFEQWIIHEKNQSDINIRSDGFYIAESFENCWHCKKTTPVFSFFLPKGHETKNDDEETETTFWSSTQYHLMLSFIHYLNDQSKACIEKISAYYYIDFSRQSSSKYYMNHCCHCNSKLGDFYMHAEPGGAFCPATIEETSNIKLFWYDELFEADAGSNSFSEAFDYLDFSSCFSRKNLEEA